MQKKLYVVGAAVVAVVVLASTGARALVGNANDVRRVRSQPHKRIEAALKLRAMPTADDLLNAQAAIQKERVRSAAKLPQPGRYTRATGRLQPQATVDAGLTWVNVGPTDAAYEFNFSGIYGVDSGRPTAIVVDPTDPNIVYDAVSGGGVWKTYNFVSGAPNPSWIPIGDTLPNLAVGALAIDPNAPGTLYLGTGDSFDVGGNQMLKSVDGGGTWSAPVTLSGTAPGQAVTFKPGAIRDIRVDPENGMNVLVATDQGLFRSTDGGATYGYIDLPNATDNVMEATWSLAYLGNHVWLVSGVQACDTADKARGPRAGFGQFTGNGGCTLGNLGDLWRSTDSGATWTSLRNTANALPPSIGIPFPDDIGRMTIAAGPTANPASTVVYVFVGNADEFNFSYTYGIFRSIDAGQTFQDIGDIMNTSVDNPTLATVFQGQTFQDCADLDIGHDQTWYNQAILVDPQNPDNVLFGGNLCGVRTRNGTSAQPTYENVSHWLPTGGGGTTSAGVLPYVHADWHAQAAFVLDGKTHAIAGTDGGVFSSSNLWDANVTPPNIVWANHNKGLANHLFYTVASGDAATGDANIVYGGLQDNGTRLRADLTVPTTFNQIIGGDGIGAAMSHGTAGTFMWGSSEFSYDLCANVQGGPTVDCTNPGNWSSAAPNITVKPTDGPRPESADAAPFFVRFVPVPTDPTGYGMLTNSNSQVWLYADYTPPLPAGSAETVDWETVPVTPVNQGDPTTGSLISPDFSQQPSPNGPADVVNMAAHPKTANVFGVVLAAADNNQTAPAAITEDATKTVGAPATLSIATTNRGSWKFATPVTVGNTNGGHLTGPQTMAFPLTQTGTPGDTYILGFSGSRYSDGTVVPANVGHLFRTTDAGQTWTSIVGADANHQLPNVGVFVVKYDPNTAGTIYAGTLIGVYISKDDGATWDRFGDGLPMVLVRDLFVASNSDFVRVATYGRGVWEIYPSDTETQGVQGDGDYDRNLQLDWVDLGAMGARLGTNPSTTTAPLYTWIDDMNPGTASPPTASIDEDDLGQLLAGFGGHP